MQDLITVFIPTYNSEMFIKDSLDSILSQTYYNLEILVVDDGSSDNTMKIVESYNDSRIVIIKNTINKGIPYTRNIGLENAKGRYLAFLDSDDISDHNRIKKQFEIFKKRPKVGVVTTKASRFPASKKNHFKFKKHPQLINYQLLFKNVVVNSSAMINLDIIKKQKISYDENYFVAQDYKFWAEISKKNIIYELAKPLTKYRIHQSNITFQSQKDNLNYRIKLINQIKDNLLSHYSIILEPQEKNFYFGFFSEKIVDFKAEYNCLKKLYNKVSSQITNKYFRKALNESCADNFYKLKDVKFPIIRYFALTKSLNIKNLFMVFRNR